MGYYDVCYLRETPFYVKIQVLLLWILVAAIIIIAAIGYNQRNKFIVMSPQKMIMTSISEGCNYIASML